MPKGYVGNTPFKVHIGADRVKAIYKGSEPIYTSGYVVYDNGNDCDYKGAWNGSTEGTTGSTREVHRTPYLYVRRQNTRYTEAYLQSETLPFSQYNTMRITCMLITCDQYGTRGTSNISVGTTQIFSGNAGNGRQYEALTERVVDISNITTDTYLKLYAKSGVDTTGAYYGIAQVTKIVLE